MDTSSECTKCRDFSAIAIEIFDAGENIAAMFGPQKCPAPSPESLAIFACDGKSLAIAIILAIFRGIMRPHCGLAGDGDVCDRKPREFAIAIFGALTTSLYNKSRDSCAMPHKNRHQIVLRYCYKYRAAGLLSQNHSCNDYMTAPYVLGTHHFGHRNLKIA